MAAQAFMTRRAPSTITGPVNKGRRGLPARVMASSRNMPVGLPSWVTTFPPLGTGVAAVMPALAMAAELTIKLWPRSSASRTTRVPVAASSLAKSASDQAS
jgi:hypothetical protein